MKPRTITRLTVLLLLVALHGTLVSRAAEESFPVTTSEAHATGQNPRTPEELIAALGRNAKPDWTARFRPPVPTTLGSRAQTALVIGSVFCDGYLAAQAEDAQQCRNVGKDLIALAKTLGVQADLLDRSRSFADSAQKKDWPVLRRELSAMEADLATSLRQHNDDGLAHLVSLGAWMRSVEIVAAVLKENYSEPAAHLLRQPALGKLFAGAFEPLNEKLRADALLTLLRPRLASLEATLGGSPEISLSQDEVRLLADSLTAILQEITSR